MSDYKELIAELDVWQKDAENCELIPPNVFRKCKYAIRQLVKERDDFAEVADEWQHDYFELVGFSEQFKRERDAAIGELRNIPNSCRFCKWYTDESCIIPNTCCIDDSPDRWEWRGVQNEID